MTRGGACGSRGGPAVEGACGGLCSEWTGEVTASTQLPASSGASSDFGLKSPPPPEMDLGAAVRVTGYGPSCSDCHRCEMSTYHEYEPSEHVLLDGLNLVTVYRGGFGPLSGSPVSHEAEGVKFLGPSQELMP